MSANYELSHCRKQVYAWSAEPDETGSAASWIDQCAANDTCKRIIDESQTGVVDSLTGEARGIPYNGIYFFVVRNPVGRAWSLSWECRGG